MLSMHSAKMEILPVCNKNILPSVGQTLRLTDAKPRSYFSVWVWACPVLSVGPGSPQHRSAAAPSPTVWPRHPCMLLEAISALSLHTKLMEAGFVKPNGKTHIIKHIPMSPQFPKLLFKPPVHYHCISLIIDFQQRLTCNRRPNCALAFRDCSFPAGNPRHRWQN